MGIDLVLQGRAGWSLKDLIGANPSLLDRALDWFRNDLKKALYRFHHYRDECGELHLTLYLHPLYWFDVTQKEKNEISIWARSNPLGPGYHCYICDVFHKMGKALNLKWTVLEDDTDYFERGEAEHVEAVTLKWLGAVARHMVETNHEENPRILLNMDLDEGYLFDGILTPMGPRDRAWLERTAADPRQGIDIFPWWHRDPTKSFKCWAEALMWNEVRWRKSLNKNRVIP